MKEKKKKKKVRISLSQTFLSLEENNPEKKVKEYRYHTF